MKTDLFWGVLCSWCVACATPALLQGQDDRSGMPSGGTFRAMSSDCVYWNGMKCLMNSSPLSCFDGYRDLFPDIPFYHVSRVSASGYGPDLQDKNYCVVWKIVNDSLYLNDIAFLFDEQKIRTEYLKPGEAHRTVCRLTGGTFCLRPGADSLMFASWVDDTLYVKTTRLGLPGRGNLQGADKWIAAPYYRLVFRNGLLVASRMFGDRENTLFYDVPRKSPVKRNRLTIPFLIR